VPQSQHVVASIAIVVASGLLWPEAFLEGERSEKGCECGTALLQSVAKRLQPSSGRALIKPDSSASVRRGPDGKSGGVMASA
jgi:hypothetical protein